MMDMGKDLMHLAFGFLSIATIALLVGHAQETVTIAKGVGGTFNGLLQTVTLQNQYSNPFSM